MSRITPGSSGFAPCYNPEIIVAVLWENVGVHGQFAAPTARDIMKAYFDKKVRTAEAEAARQMQKSNPANAIVSALLPANKLRDADVKAAMGNNAGGK